MFECLNRRRALRFGASRGLSYRIFRGVFLTPARKFPPSRSHNPIAVPTSSLIFRTSSPSSDLSAWSLLLPFDAIQPSSRSSSRPWQVATVSPLKLSRKGPLYPFADHWNHLSLTLGFLKPAVSTFSRSHPLPLASLSQFPRCPRLSFSLVLHSALLSFEDECIIAYSNRRYAISDIRGHPQTTGFKSEDICLLAISPTPSIV